ncbi:MAG TPA: hypothetical protein VGC42_22785 [Kofleriaceae bacterium]
MLVVTVVVAAGIVAGDTVPVAGATGVGLTVVVVVDWANADGAMARTAELSRILLSERMVAPLFFTIDHGASRVPRAAKPLTDVAQAIVAARTARFDGKTAR